LGNCHVFFAAVDDAHGPLRAQGFEGANGTGCLALGPAFEVLAQQHQGDDHRRSFEVKVRGHAGRGLGPLVQAQAITRAGAQGDQQVHVACSSTHGFVGGFVEACTENELHRGGQRELRPGGQHPVQAEGLHQHRQHQWQGQQQRGSDSQAFIAQASLGILLIILGRLRQAGAVTGFFDSGNQQRVIERLQHFKVGTLAGQVDADLFNLRQFAEGALHAADAAGTGHAADLQLHGPGRHAIAGAAHGFNQGWQATCRGLDPGLFSGEVDADLIGAADLSQGALDTARTAGAGHAGNRQVESVGCGHGSPPWQG